MIQHIGIIGLLLIILILIVVFIICRCIGKIVQRPICSSALNDLHHNTVKYGGAANIQDTLNNIINTKLTNLKAIDINRLPPDDRIPIIPAFKTFNDTNELHSSYMEAFDKYREYIYDYNIIENLIDQISAEPSDDIKLLIFIENCRHNIDINKFVKLKITSLSYLINKHNGITNNIMHNYLNLIDYNSYKQKNKLIDLIYKYNNMYNFKTNKISKFKEIYYKFSAKYRIFELFYDIYDKICNNIIFNKNNLKNYLILQYNKIIKPFNVNLPEKAINTNKDNLEYCCHKLNIDKNIIFNNIAAAITNADLNRFDYIETIKNIKKKYNNYKLYEKMPMINIKNSRWSGDYTNGAYYFEHNIYARFNDNIKNNQFPNIEKKIAQNDPFDEIQIIVLYKYIQDTYTNIFNTTIQILDVLINTDILLINADTIISDKNTEFIALDYDINMLIFYIDKLYELSPEKNKNNYYNLYTNLQLIALARNRVLTNKNFYDKLNKDLTILVDILLAAANTSPPALPVPSPALPVPSPALPVPSPALPVPSPALPVPSPALPVPSPVPPPAKFVNTQEETDYNNLNQLVKNVKAIKKSIKDKRNVIPGKSLLDLKALVISAELDITNIKNEHQKAIIKYAEGVRNNATFANFHNLIVTCETYVTSAETYFDTISAAELAATTATSSYDAETHVLNIEWGATQLNYSQTYDTYKDTPPITNNQKYIDAYAALNNKYNDSTTNNDTKKDIIYILKQVIDKISNRDGFGNEKQSKQSKQPKQPFNINFDSLQKKYRRPKSGGSEANIDNIKNIIYKDIETIPNHNNEQLTSLKWAFYNINNNMNNDFKLLDSFFSEFITILRESNPSLIPEKPVWVKEEKKYNYFMPPVKDLIVPKKLKESIASIYSMITNESNKVSKTIEILQHIPIIKEKNKVYYNPLTPEEKKMIKKKLLKEDRDELDEEYDIDEIINGMKTNNLVYGRYTLYKDNMWKTIIIPII